MVFEHHYCVVMNIELSTITQTSVSGAVVLNKRKENFADYSENRWLKYYGVSQLRIKYHCTRWLCQHTLSSHKHAYQLVIDCHPVSWRRASATPPLNDCCKVFEASNWQLIHLYSQATKGQPTQSRSNFLKKFNI